MNKAWNKVNLYVGNALIYTYVWYDAPLFLLLYNKIRSLFIT